MAFLSRTVDQAIDFAERQSVNPTQSWDNLCQSFCRQAYGVNAWASSAKEAWGKIPKDKKRSGGHPEEAPRGALIYFDSGTYGHVALCIGKSTNDKCWSNDYVERGKIDKAPRDFPRWGLRYAGWSMWTPYGEMKPWEPDPLWDGKVPDIEGLFNAQNDAGLANPAAYRLACRLFDLGMFSGTPVEGAQKYPAKGVGNFQRSKAMKVNPEGAYSPEIHGLIFP